MPKKTNNRYKLKKNKTKRNKKFINKLRKTKLRKKRNIKKLKTKKQSGGALTNPPISRSISGPISGSIPGSIPGPIPGSIPGSIPGPISRSISEGPNHHQYRSVFDKLANLRKDNEELQLENNKLKQQITQLNTNGKLNRKKLEESINKLIIMMAPLRS